MKATSTKLAFLMILFVLTSGLPFRMMIGLGAEAQSYKCKSDGDCERQCDPRRCLKNCLGLPSTCINGQCACPFGPEHSATKTLPNSTCTLLHGDCSKLCPSDCNIRSCLKGKCQCGCRG